MKIRKKIKNNARISLVQRLFSGYVCENNIIFCFGPKRDLPTKRIEALTKKRVGILRGVKTIIDWRRRRVSRAQSKRKTSQESAEWRARPKLGTVNEVVGCACQDFAFPQ